MKPTTFLRATPVLRVSDYRKSRAFYCERLGFHVVEEGGEPPLFGILERDHCVLFLNAHQGGPSKPGTEGGWDAYLHLRGLIELRTQWGEADFLCGPLRETNYGMRELELLDPDGNRICLGEELQAPSPRISRQRYVLAVPNLAQSSEWYQRVLGCQAEVIDGGDWAFLKSGSVTFMLGNCPGALPLVELGDHSYFAYLEVDDLSVWFDRAQREGAQITKQPRSEPWGMREFGMRTVDGHRIMLGQTLAPPGP